MKSRKLFLALLIVLIVAIGLVAVACDRTVEPPPISEGPETGTYFYDATDGEYLLTLNSGDKFTLIIAGESKSGSYTLNESALTLTFNIEEDGTLNAEYATGVVRLTYEGVQMLFRRMVNYTVTFNAQGGSEVESVSVLNGRTIVKPADPVKDGHVFAGWFTDEACTTPYAFGTQAVTANVTLYAKWIAVEVGVLNYTIDFDLGYAEAEAIESVQTLNGKLFGIEDPTREGYNFQGWWISDSESRDKLTVKCTEDTVFTQDTTLFAVWTNEQTLMPSVNANGVTWNAIPATSTYSVLVYNEEGAQVRGDESHGSQVYDVDWANLPAGEYRIVVSCGELSATRYYTNKALDRVSLFTVVNNVLTFNAIENAENYLITIECGNPQHRHSDLNNGLSTSYDFANCPMVEGGIKFTVTAQADGYATSVSRTFVVNRVLEAIPALVVDEAKEIISWDPVAFATGYVVSIACEGHEEEHLENIGNKTNVCYKECAGDITVNVYPVAKGYNSPECATIEVAKQTLATPANLKVEGNVVSWDAVEGATGYELNVNGTVIDADTNECDLTSTIAGMEVGVDLVVNVAAKGAKKSLPSDNVTLRNNDLYGTIKYNNNIVSWRHVLGAARYEVKVNGVIVDDEIVGNNFAEVVLTRAGENTISVSYYNAYDEQSNEASISVYAYSVRLNPENGQETQVTYAALGDNVVFPESIAQNGYTIEGWYDIPGGARANGAEYTEKVLSTPTNLSLYANWIPETYTIRFMYGDNDVATGTQETDEIEFGSNDSIFAPTPLDPAKAFVAWTSIEGELSKRVSNAYGELLKPWEIYETDDNNEIKLYPIWTKAFIFTEEANNTYSVSKDPVGIHKADILTVPETYNGYPVTIIADFQSCGNLKELNFSSTVTLVNAAAFDGCTRLNEINVYEGVGVPGPYSSGNGILVVKRDTGEREIAYVSENTRGIFKIPSNVTSLSNALAGKAISEVVIPASVNVIRANAFAGCASLRKVEFEARTNPINVEKGAFANCSALTEITLPVGFTLSGAKFYEVFSGCTSLENVNVEAGHASYMSNNGLVLSKDRTVLEFYPVGRTGAAQLPNNIYTVADYAFASHAGVTSVVIPDTVVTIGKNAFAQCPNLVSVVIGANTQFIGDQAFFQCRLLESVTFNNTVLETIGEMAFAAYDLEATQSYSLTTLNDVRLPSSVKTIGAGAFYYQANAIVNLEIPNATEIGAKAFYNAEQSSSKLFTANLSSVTTIGTLAFYHCDNLVAITVGALVAENVAEDAFANCRGVYEVCDAGNLGIAAGSAAFGGVAQHAKYVRTAADATRIATTTDGNYTYYYDGTNAYLLKYNGNENVVTLPATLGDATSYVIASGAFLNASFITELTISTAVTSIQSGSQNANSFYDTYPAFYGCTNLRVIYNLAGLTLTGGADDNGCVAKYASAANIFTDASAQSPYVTYEGAIFDVKKNASGTITSVTLVGLVDNDTTVVLPDFYVEEETEYPFTITSTSFNGYTVEHLTVGKGVTSIANNLFKGNTVLKSFTYNGNGSATIGENAFANCTALETVRLTGVVTVSKHAFSTGSTSAPTLTATDLPSIKEFYADDSLKNIREYAFLGCINLETAEIGNSLTILGNNAFRYCYALRSIAIPGTLPDNSAAGTYERGNYAFSDCTSLETVVIGEGVTVFANYIFNNCSSLVNVTLPSTLTKMNQRFFQGCSSLKSVVVPDRVTMIDTNVFEKCYSLTSVVIGRGVTSIGSNAFLDCRKLKDVVNLSNLQIVKGATTHGGIAQYAYVVRTSLGDGLTSTITEDGFEFYEIEEGGTVINYLSGYYGDEIVLVTPYDYKGESYVIGPYAFMKNYDIIDVTFGKNVTAIGAYAFSAEADHTSIMSLTLNDGLKTIGSYAFYDNNISELIIPDSVVEIQNHAFAISNNLTKLVIGNGVTTIGESAFSSCTSLPSVILGTSVETIGNSAFASCKKLFEVYNLSSLEITTGGSVTNFGGIGQFAKIIYDSLDAESPFVYINDFMFHNDNGNVTVLSYSGSSTSITFPVYRDADNNIVNYTIADNIFADNASIISVSIPDSVTAIGVSAFDKCTSLTTVSMGAGVTSIGDYAFRGCTALTSNISFGNGLTTIGQYAFQDTKITGTLNLTGVTTIGQYAFQNAAITGVTFGTAITTIGNYAFDGCTSLTGDLRFPATVNEDVESWNLTSIGQYAFRNTAITGLIIPDSVTTISARAFNACASLKYVVIGKGVTKLSGYTFQNCSSLEIIVFGSELTTIGMYEMTGLNANAKIFLRDSFNIKSSYTTQYYMQQNMPRYTYSAETPTESGNYWHFDANGVPVAW